MFSLVRGCVLHLGDAENTSADRDQYFADRHSVLGHGYWRLRTYKRVTAELYLRWFQFGAFCTLFRSHGRTWKLRLPWGWNTGDPGPVEIRNYNGASVPDA